MLTGFFLCVTQLGNITGNHNTSRATLFLLFSISRKHANEQRPLCFVIRWNFDFNGSAAANRPINHAFRALKSPNHVTAATAREETASGLFGRLTRTIYFFQSPVDAKNVNSVGQRVDGCLPHSVRGHQRINQLIGTFY